MIESAQASVRPHRKAVTVKTLVALAACTAGLAAAAALTAAPAAKAWDYGQIPNGYSVTVASGPGDGGSHPTCDGYTLNGTYVGNTCDPDFQQKFDAFIDSTICTVNPTVGQQHGLCAATTTAEATSTAAVPTPTATDPAPVQTVTVTTTVVATDPTLDARVTALEQDYKTLAARVDAIASANAAAWQTFSADLAAGADPAAAALDARSAALNAIYELG